MNNQQAAALRTINIRLSPATAEPEVNCWLAESPGQQSCPHLNGWRRATASKKSCGAASYTELVYIEVTQRYGCGISSRSSGITSSRFKVAIGLATNSDFKFGIRQGRP